MATHLDTTGRAQAKAARSDWTEAAGRVGLVARGVVYILLGIIALRIALGDSGQTADKGGALHLVAEQPAGSVMLVVLALGMVCYAAWRLIQAFTYQDDEDHKEWVKRIGYVGRAVIYLAAAWAAVSVLRNRSGGAGSASEREWTGSVLGWGLAGQLLLGAVGLAFIAAAGWNLYRAATQKFEEKLKEQEMSPQTQTTVKVLGIVGMCGRAVAFGAVGWFIVKAAVEANANEPLGLDESLRQLTQTSLGPIVLVVVAIGLALFGVYSMAEARWRDTSA